MKRNWKRWMSGLLITVLIICMLPATTAFASMDGMLRVKLESLGKNSSIVFRTNGRYILDAGYKIDLEQGTRVTVVASGNKISVQIGERNILCGRKAVFYRSGEDSMTGLSFSVPSIVNRYCGDLYLTAQDSIIEPVLNIYVEDYLKGVVGNEIQLNASLEALKTQTVVCRNQALKKKLENRLESWDLTDQDPLYRGLDLGANRVFQAVSETEGQVLYYGTTMATCYDTESNGGIIESSENVYGVPLEYSEARVDEYDVESPTAQVKTASISKNGNALNSELVSALIEGMTDTLQEWGFSTLSIDIQISQVKDVRLTDPIHEGICETYRNLELDLVVISTYEATGQPLSGEITVSVPIFGGFEDWYGLSINPEDNEVMQVQEEKASFVISFRRKGDGVGQSKRGTMVMADSYNMAYDEILSYYFPGTDLRHIELRTGEGIDPEDVSLSDPADIEEFQNSTSSPYALPTLSSEMIEDKRTDGVGVWVTPEPDTETTPEIPEIPEMTEMPVDGPETVETTIPNADPTDEPEETVIESAAVPTEEPTPEPTAEPTEEPTQEPTAEPTPEPTQEPTEEPTQEPTAEPTREPTSEPTAEPTQEPTAEPTAEPASEPTTAAANRPVVLTTMALSTATAEPTEEPEPDTEETQEPITAEDDQSTKPPVLYMTTKTSEGPTQKPAAQMTVKPIRNIYHIGQEASIETEVCEDGSARTSADEELSRTLKMKVLVGNHSLLKETQDDTESYYECVRLRITPDSAQEALAVDPQSALSIAFLKKDGTREEGYHVKNAGDGSAEFAWNPGEPMEITKLCRAGEPDIEYLVMTVWKDGKPTEYCFELNRLTTGVTTGSHVHIREGATKNTRSLAQVSAGTRLYILDATGEYWIKVLTPEGAPGYIYNSYFRLDEGD